MNSNIIYIEKLMIELEAKDNLIAIHEKMLESVSDNLSAAVWGKNIDGQFIYANKACCDMILRCSEDEAISMGDKDFKNNTLANVCIKSDQKVIKCKRTIRFIEHAIYKDQDMWISTLKSPWFKGDKIIGTVGIGTNISDQISFEDKEKYKSVKSLEISLNAEISDIFN